MMNSRPVGDTLDVLVAAAMEPAVADMYDIRLVLHPVMTARMVARNALAEDYIDDI